MQTGDKTQLVDDREKLEHVIWQEQEAAISSSLGDLGHSYRQFRSQLLDYASLMGREESSSPHTNKGGMPGSETSKFLDRLLKVFDGPISIENFHQTAAKVLTEYLSADPFFLKQPTWFEDHLQSTRDSMYFVAGGKISHAIEKIETLLSKQLSRQTMNLLYLYEEEEVSFLIREKRMKGFKLLMETDRYIKMDLDTQIRQLQVQRREIYEQSNFLKLPKQSAKTPFNVRLSSEDFMTEFLNAFAEKRDYVYVLFEEKMVELLIDEIFKYHKHSKLNTLLEHLDNLPHLLYSKDYSFAVDRYLTNSIVKGSRYISNKKTQSLIVDPNLISRNLLETICDYQQTNPLQLQKFASTQYYDNITISTVSLDVLYNSFTVNPPSVLLVLKNLSGAYLEDVDNAENIYYSNPLDTGFHTLTCLVRLLNKELGKNFLGTKAGSIITA